MNVETSRREPETSSAGYQHDVAPQERWTLASWAERRPVALSMALVFVVLYTRGLPILHNPQPIWDDGNFIAEGIIYGGPASWFRPYAGYINLLPRMLSDGFTIFNLLDAPWWAGVISLTVMAWAFCLILGRGFDYLMPLRWRVLVVCGLALLPWYTEVFATLFTIQWPLFAGLALFSIANYEAMSKPARLTLPIATAAILFSTTTSVLVFPVFALRMLASARDRRSYTFRYTLLTTAMIVLNAVIVLTTTVHISSSWPGTVSVSDRPDLVTFLHFLVKGVGFKVVEQSVFGMRAAMHVLAFPAAYSAAFAGWLVLTAAAILLASARDRRILPLAWAAVAYYTVATIVFAGTFRNEYVVAHFIRDRQYGGADRYFLPASVFFYLTVVWVVQALTRIRARHAVLGIMAAGFALAVATNFEYPPRPEFRWRESVFSYYETLLATRGTPNPPQFRIVILPPAYEWNLVLPLYELSSADRDRIQAILSRERRR